MTVNLMQPKVTLKMKAYKVKQDFPGGIVDRNSPADAGDVGSITGLKRFHML